MRGRFLGLVLLAAAIGMYFLGRQIGADGSAVGTARTLKVIAAATGTIGLGLFLFRRIVLTPWFMIDVSRRLPRLNIGPPGLRFILSAEPDKGYLHVPFMSALFCYFSFFTRQLIKLSIVTPIVAKFAFDVGLLASAFATGVGVLLLTPIEWWIMARLAIDPARLDSRVGVETEAPAVSGETAQVVVAARESAEPARDDDIPAV